VCNATLLTFAGLVYAPIAPLVLGFATIGLGLFYLAWRYNVFFVTDTGIDTRGLIYPRALKHLFAGIYIAEICMIGLFGVSAAPGPAVLMLVFLIFTALFNITLNRAIDPLLYNLPRTLGAEEQTLRLEVSGVSNGEKNGTDKGSAVERDAGKKEPGLISKFLKPWSYCDYASLRQLVPHDSVDVNNLYTDEVERNAYFPPAISSVAPLLWIPEDKMGISKQEIRDTGKVIPITDEGCVLNDNNKLEWDTESVRPPVWEEKVLF
jgi:calcium permeable stress-gated cation channel